MIRDFTLEKYNELCQYLPSDNREFLTTCDELGLAGEFQNEELRSELAEIESYYANVFDKYDTTKATLNNIFVKAREADDRYAKILEDTSLLVKNYRAYIKSMSAVFGEQPEEFTVSRVLEKMRDCEEQRRSRMLVCVCNLIDIGKANLNSLTEEEINILKEYLQENYIDVYSVMPNRESLPQGDKEFIISLFEICYPEYAENINICLEPIVEEGRTDVATNIKVIAYTAPDPYRTIFLETINDIKLVDLHYDDGVAEYSRTEGGIRFNIDEFDYNTFFHECGHAIDDQLIKGKDYLTGVYQNEEGYTLAQTLENEVRENIRECAEAYINKQNIEGDYSGVITEIENIFMNCFNKDNYQFNFSSKFVENCYYYTEECLNSEIKYIASDIYGGFTGNLLRNVNGHDVISHPDTKDAYGYWVVTNKLDAEGIPIPTYEKDGSFAYRMQEKEFFAEYFSAHMVYNEEDLGSISEEKQLLDTSAEYADELVQYIYSNVTE